MLQRHLPGKLRQFLEYFDKNHLANVLLGCSTRPMRANDPDHQRIQPSHQLARCFIVVLKRSFNQSACVRIIHVIESASTPISMTSGTALWLQLLVWSCLCQAAVDSALAKASAVTTTPKKFCNRYTPPTVMTFKSAKKRFQKT